MGAFRSTNNAVEVASFPGTERETVSPLIACSATEGVPCNGHGECRSGACECVPGYSGFRCEVSTSVGFCNTYRACAECTAFLEVCPDSCANMAQFNLVYGFPPSVSSGFRSCRSRSAERRCSFNYMQESETQQGWKTIMVKACQSEMGPKPSIPSLIPTTSSEAYVTDDKTSATTGTTPSTTSQSSSTSTTGTTQSSTTQGVSNSTTRTTQASTSRSVSTSTTVQTTTVLTTKAIPGTMKSLPKDTQHDDHKVGHADGKTADPRGAGSNSHADLVIVLVSFVALMNI